MFQNIRWPSGIKAVHLEWLEPGKGEGLTDYCQRFAAGIDITKPFVLIGLSFGGIVATELSELLKPADTILISSIACAAHIPPYYKLIGTLRLHKLVPPRLLQYPTPLNYWAFGAKTTEERKLLKQTLEDTSPSFLRWAINSILAWRQKGRPERLFHIHGTADRILPFRFTRADRAVRGGGHLMVYSRAAEVSKLIEDRFAEWS
jgi:pimeloyl-ACP methyl ester carboxylesterase